MKKLIYTSILVVLFGIASTAPALTEAPKTTSIDDYFNQLTTNGQFNGTVAVFSPEHPPYIKAFNSKQLPLWARINPTSHFHIASVAKLFPRYIIMRDKNLSEKMDIPISVYMESDFVHPAWTLRMLLEHTSGLPRGEQHDFAQAVYTPAETKDLIKRQTLLFEPGTNEHYSNFGFKALMLVLAEYYGIGPRELLQNKVFRPLTMTSTSEFLDSKQNTHLAAGVRKENGDIIPSDTNLYGQFPFGNVFSNPQDLYKFAKIASHIDIFEDEVEHAGAISGFRSYLYYNDATETALIILSNYGNMPITQVIRDSRTLLEGGEVPLPTLINRTAIKMNMKTAKMLSGVYQLVINGQFFEITYENGDLKIWELNQNKRTNPEPLFMEENGIFFTDPTSNDSIMINLETGKVAITGMGGMSFDLKRIDNHGN
ncbi:serine hydrolase domain-containing protein [Kordiimonas laminariae]|uniref:serine hydrolase domain-containing protein n=1 Tax=Kordiimonas laminariae TaxID=2917717 RepID=UPI001FF44544|nr:serine hydrolase domain-containing protein [Kordiimonas laminariae]MCK0070764.1 beta-lactamase family protein [Kordiimonas laminariae]